MWVVAFWAENLKPVVRYFGQFRRVQLRVRSLHNLLPEGGLVSAGRQRMSLELVGNDDADIVVEADVEVVVVVVVGVVVGVVVVVGVDVVVVAGVDVVFVLAAAAAGGVGGRDDDVDDDDWAVASLMVPQQLSPSLSIWAFPPTR